MKKPSQRWAIIYAVMEFAPITMSGKLHFCGVAANFENRASSQKQQPPLKRVQAGVQMRFTMGQMPRKWAASPAAMSVAEEFEKRVIHLLDVVKLARGDAGHGEMVEPFARRALAIIECFIALMAVSKVAHDAGIALNDSGFVTQSHVYGVGPESRAVFSNVPSFTGRVAFPGGAQEFLFNLDEELGCLRIEEGKAHSEDFLAFIAVHPFRAAVPGDDAAVCVKKAKGEIRRPGGVFSGGDFVSGLELLF